MGRYQGAQRKGGTGMKQTLKVNNMPPSLTKYRNMHYQVINNQKQEWESIIGWLVKEQKIQPMQQIKMTYEFYFRNRTEHDPDNYACCAKFINDGLVKAVVLPRDNFVHIKEFTVKQGGVCKQPYILIHMEEVSA
jgi:glucan biosynthesis protein